MVSELIYIALDPELEGQACRPDRPMARCNRLEDVLALKSDPLGYAVGTASVTLAREAVAALRAKNETAVKPVFLMAQMPEDIVNMTDGFADSLDNAWLEAQKIHEHLKELDASLFSEHDAAVFRLLAFLYSRPGRHLDPVRHWSYPMLYQYPLADSILGEKENSLVWLKNLVDRNLLRFGELKDRIRLCPQCSTARLNYVDVCPNCSGIDILQKPFLHCFTCGSVSPEEEFMEKGYLGCPNCRTRLRHIGADYDRALESYTCNHCAHKFEEPQVTAHCQDCSARTPPGDLLARNIYSFDITEQGRTCVKTGLMEDVYAILDTLDNLNPAFFESILEWQLKLNLRYPDIMFSLVGIRFLNILELSERYGRWRVAELMDEFVGRIRELLRTTDLTSRSSRRNFWILLPRTDAAGSATVIDRIQKARQQTLQEDGTGIEINTTCFCVPRDVTSGETASLLMARLSGEIE